MSALETARRRDFGEVRQARLALAEVLLRTGRRGTAAARELAAETGLSMRQSWRYLAKLRSEGRA